MCLNVFTRLPSKVAHLFLVSVVWSKNASRHSSTCTHSIIYYDFGCKHNDVGLLFSTLPIKSNCISRVRLAFAWVCTQMKPWRSLVWACVPSVRTWFSRPHDFFDSSIFSLSPIYFCVNSLFSFLLPFFGSWAMRPFGLWYHLYSIWIVQNGFGK